MAQENKIQVTGEGPDRAFFAKMSSYNEVIQDGLDILFENDTDLGDLLNNVDREFNEYKELRESLYRYRRFDQYILYYCSFSVS